MQMWSDAGVSLCSRPWTTLYARFRANSATNMACSRLAQMGCSGVTRHALGTVVVMQTKFSSTSERNCSLIAGGTAFTSNTYFVMHPSPRHHHAFSLEVHFTEQSTAFVACLTSQANCHWSRSACCKPERVFQRRHQSQTESSMPCGINWHLQATFFSCQRGY